MLLRKETKKVFSKLQDERKKHEPKHKLGDLVGAPDIKKVFSKGDSTNNSYELYTISGTIDETILAKRVNCSREKKTKNY